MGKSPKAVKSPVIRSLWKPRSIPKDERRLAVFVRHVTLGSRQEYPPNKILTKTWVMRNSGLVEWGNNIHLCFTKGDVELCDDGVGRVPVINAQPGQEVEMSVTLNTGNTGGRMCAYFRLNASGKFFGPRLWADVIVAVSGGDFKEHGACRADKKLMRPKMGWKESVPCK